jgi:hypothetical protein
MAVGVLLQSGALPPGGPSVANSIVLRPDDIVLCPDAAITGDDPRRPVHALWTTTPSPSSI